MKIGLSSWLLLVAALPVSAQEAVEQIAPYPPEDCSSCAEWNRPREPFRIFGNTYWVGTEGLGAILITSDEGHILIDGALPESARMIARNIEALGFVLDDVRLILNTHAHSDHAGGIAPLQRATGAQVAASEAGKRALESGSAGPDDPQYGDLLDFPAVANVRVIQDGDVLRVGSTAVTARFTPAHAPGGTSWSWESCESGRCLQVVYADSQSPRSAGGFFYTRGLAHRNATTDFERGMTVERGLALLATMPCDILISPHPGASGFFERVARRDGGQQDALVDAQACRRYAAAARQQLHQRIESEKGGQ